MSRTAARLNIVARALWSRATGGRRRPQDPRRILLVHQLLLGDTLMTTPLVAKLRALHPQADIAMAMPPAFVPLYSGKPFGLRALPLSMKRPETVAALLAEAPWDWAILPGDNRFSWLAQAARARWISGWERDTPGYKNWLVDDARPWPSKPAALGDLWSDLVVGARPAPYRAENWPAPDCAHFEHPPPPYAVLHVGASNVSKLWPADHWRALATQLEADGLTVVYSAGRGEEALVQACDPDNKQRSYAGQLDLAQMWHLLKHAELLVAPDTGIAHLAKVTGTPTVALFGRGPTPLYGRGEFWSAMPFTAAVLDELAPRPQGTLFKRPFRWLKSLFGNNNIDSGRSFICFGSGPEFVAGLAISARRRG